jgi:hypothetical protein
MQVYVVCLVNVVYLLSRPNDANKLDKPDPRTRREMAPDTVLFGSQI